MRSRIGLTLLVTGVLSAMMPGASAAVPAEGLDLKGKIPADAQQVGGAWSIADDTLSQSDAAARPQLLLLGNADWNDYVVRTSVRLKNAALGAEAGLVLQARDSNNYLVFSLVARRSG